ncbi:hypothetical protein FBU31_003537 [Coemansia sp. 'formosensis']|nr:hypothetical protein FBU31_003537 [Coemansia sp. 'formosensis']
MYIAWRRLGPVAPRVVLRRYTDIAAQVRQIAHPSEYAQIEHTKGVAQQARLQGEDIGERLRAEGKQHRSLALSQLGAVFKSVTTSTEPTLADFSAVFEGYQALESASHCVQVLQAMREAGHRATAAQLGSALSLASSSHSAAAVAGVGEEMRACGVADGSYDSHVIASLAARGSVEHAYAEYVEARRAGQHAISRAAYSQLVGALADAGECDLALAVLRDAGAGSVALGEPTYRALLRGAGRAMHHGAYAAAYAHLTAVVGAQLTETDYCAGLAVAARAADATLAAAIVRRMRSAGYALAEYHMEPMFDALVGAKKWPAAFRALAAMRDAGFATTGASLRGLTRALTVDHHQAEQLVDAVHAELVAVARTAPRALDTTTLNALVAALALSGCVEAAAERLRRWFGAARRDVGSYVAVLRGCAARKNKTVAEQCLAMCIDEDGLVPTQDVYEIMVDVALRQFNYEDAFVYLDAMKVHGFTPGWRTYALIVRRCAAVRDPRASIALAEMRSAGYAVSVSLTDYVKNAGRSARYTRSDPEKPDDDDANDGDGDLDLTFKL